MKKWICTILCTLIAVMGFCGCADKSSPAEDFEYEMVDGEVIITNYIGTDLEIVVPSEINGRPVTVIGEEAFAEYDMKRITLPDSVVKIEGYAFCNCVCLTSVSLSDNLEIIDDGAFSGCVVLEDIKFPRSLKKINGYAFYRNGFKEVTLPKTLEFLGAHSFARCDNLTSLVIPDNTKIEIGVNNEGAGQVCYVTFFDSPVGGSNTTTYYDGAATGSEEFSKLPTAVVVSAGSYAHEQVRPYEGYGLTIEIAGEGRNEDDGDKNNGLDFSDLFETKETYYLLTECVQKNKAGEILRRSTYDYDDRGLVISYQSDLSGSIDVWNEALGVYVYQPMPCDGEADRQAFFGYDQYGSPVSVNGGGYGEWMIEYTYDDKGRLVSYKPGAIIDLEYGEDGVIKQWRRDQSRDEDPLRIIETSKTEKERIEKITYKEREGEITCYFEYDDTGHMTEFYQHWGSMEPDCKTACVYDEAGRITAESGLRCSVSDQITYQYENDMLVAINGERLELLEDDNGKIIIGYKDYQLTYVPLELTAEEIDISRHRWNQFCGGFLSPHNYSKGLDGVRYPVFDLNTVLPLPKEIYS